MLAHTQLQILNENIQLQKRCLHAKLNNYHNTFVFCSEKMNSIFEQASMIAESDVPILITGETGTGKELLAQHIHDLSLVRENLFIKVNCPALPTSLFESELFGHEKGSFTGAYAARIGRFEMAHGGSIFLDEIGDLPLPLQAKLLQVLQDGTFERVGTSKSIKAEFRIISATNQNLQDAINKGQFRKDLYYRLSTITLNLPPLRERTEDIPFLVEHFNSLEVKRTGSPPLLFDPSAIDTLCHYTWPGNVRELKNFVKKMFLLMPAMTLKGSNISKHLGNNGNTENREFHELHEREKKLIENALAHCRGVVGGPNGAAKRLGLATSTLQYRIKKFGIDPLNFVSRNNNWY
jgi:transcriptional regulator with GAF, ATPase, and Fis domain